MAKVRAVLPVMMVMMILLYITTDKYLREVIYSYITGARCSVVEALGYTPQGRGIDSR
jgi:hypothetical protein